MALLQKPIVVDKFREFHKYVKANNNQIGTKQRGLDININNACNLTCEHCFTLSPKGLNANKRMSVEKLTDVANQAHELGIFEIDLQGGELLLNPKYLFSVLENFGTERFYMYLTTNGFFMTNEIAKKLADLGIDRVSVSIDSMDPETHDKFRGKKGCWERAIKALEMVKNVGITPYLNITVGKYNVDSEDLRLLLDYSKDKKYTTLLNIATPGGMWRNMHDICITEEDSNHLIQMRKEYKNILRNLWDPFDRNRERVIGCNTVNRLYITPIGDVLPCPYVHIGIGNIFESSLKEISENGFKVKYFREYSEKCLAGEDKEFIKNYMAKDGTTIFNPLKINELFKAEDLIEEKVTLPAVIDK